MELHRALFICKRDAHLFERDFIQRAGNFQSFRLLILLQTGTRSCIKFAALLAAVETSLLQDGLSLLDLICGGAKDWFPVRVGVPG